MQKTFHDTFSALALGLALLTGSAAFLAGPSLPSCYAQEVPTADAILQQAQKNREIGSSIQTLTLTTWDKNGNAKEKQVTSRIKQGADGLGKSYIRFDGPADYAGVQFLSREVAGAEAEQFSYMPSMGGDVTQITGSSRSGAFFGTDFSYEDLAIGDPKDGDHKNLGRKQVELAGEKLDVWEIETVPKAELKSAYTRLVTWVDIKTNMPRQVVFFDKKGEESKRMTLREIKVDGARLVPMVTEMQNLKKGTRTEIRILDYRADVPEGELPDSMFTPDYMKSQG